MRAFTLYFSLLFFLLIGRTDGYALNTPTSHPHKAVPSTSLQHKVAFDTNDQNHSLFENADFDVEEDQLHNDTSSGSNYSNQSATPIAFAHWYWANYPLFIHNYSAKRYKSFPKTSVSATPIYLAQRVLRI